METPGNFHCESSCFHSKDGYLIEFESDYWRLNRDIKIPIHLSKSYMQSYDLSLRHVLKYYSQNSSASHALNIFCRFMHYVRAIKGGEVFSVESLISYRSMLSKKNAWYLSALRGGIRQWSKLGYPGVGSDVLALLDMWTIKGNEKGFAVESMCPSSGPFTDIELQGILSAVSLCFSSKRISLRDTCLAMLLAMTGRRSSQIAALKLKDISADSDGYWINFPRAKQRNQYWRSTFNRVSIVNDLWVLLSQQSSSVCDEFAKAIGQNLSSDVIPNLPLFPKELRELSAGDLEPLLANDVLHVSSRTVAVRLLHVSKKIGVKSERTGVNISLSPVRFRYTLGTNLAREGRGEYVIAEALDHSDIQNVGVYVKNVPEIAGRIDKAVAFQLAPYAQAFNGMLVTSEGEAKRGDIRASRISDGTSNIGTCGSYGFCDSNAPISCYTCVHFQPWLDAPHEKILDYLIEERDLICETCDDLKIASINDRVILAVADVIRRCQVAKVG